MKITESRQMKNTPIGSISHLNKRETKNWIADMIVPLADNGVGSPASFVKKRFSIANNKNCNLYISAFGLYRVFLNGKAVSNDRLTPGWTCYDDRVAYQSYDISNLIETGLNEIEIWLGDGWFRSPIMWHEYAIENCWGEEIAAIAEIEQDGKIICKTDDSWKSGSLPIVKSGIYWGEDYDARIQPMSTDSVKILPVDKSLFVKQEADCVSELEPLEPITSWDETDATIFDFGQNIAGYTQIKVDGEEGTKFTIEFAEVIGPNKQFDNRNFRSARASLTYIVGKAGEASWAPTFTFMGFRYARVTIEGSGVLNHITAIPITSVPVITGGFTCDVPSVNKLVNNTIWSQRGNFIEIPTDCPQRDERLGWTGDAQVFAGTACWLADSERFLLKYLRDVMHDQRPNGAIPHFAPDPTRRPGSKFEGDWAGSTGWGDVITIMPWQLYLHYGDDQVLKECFPAMRRWLDYLWSISNGPIIRPHSNWGTKGFTFGDWLQPIGDNRKPRPTIADDCAATIYHYISTELAAKIAVIIGEDSEELEQRARIIKTAFANEYISPSGRLAHNDQTSYALAFLNNLIPSEHFDQAKVYFRRVVEDADYLIGTGFIGTPALLPALSKLGMVDLVEKVFLNKNVPGWLYQVEQGATTIWERWDALAEDGTIYDPDMNSYNHYAYGAVCQFLFENIAGIQPTPEAPGFDEVLINPTVLSGLGKISMWHDCRRGRISAQWKILGGDVHYEVTLPNGCVGRLSEKLGSGTVTEGNHKFIFKL